MSTTSRKIAYQDDKLDTIEREIKLDYTKRLALHIAQCLSQDSWKTGVKIKYEDVVKTLDSFQVGGYDANCYTILVEPEPRTYDNE
jgi:hypothetical protein